MSERAVVDEWLRDLAADIGASDLSLDESGLCAFRYDDTCDIAVEVPTGAGLVFFYSALMPAPGSDPAAFHRHLLELNAYMVGSRGGALGLDSQTDEVLLSRAEPLAALDRERFARMLTNFIDAAIGLKADLEAFHPDATAKVDELDPRLMIIRA